MKLHIILDYYFLKFMYGSSTFQDKRLLRVEVLKKAFHDGVYFVGDKKTIKKILNKEKVDINVYAGVPSIEELALLNRLNRNIHTLKLNLFYEDLIEFELDNDKLTSNVSYNNIRMEEIDYFLGYQDKAIITNNKDEYKDTDIVNYFIMMLKEYRYMLIKNANIIHDKLCHYLSSKESIKILDDKNKLEELAMLYESLEWALKR